MLFKHGDHFIGVENIPDEGSLELCYKLWAVQNTLHRGENDRRYLDIISGLR